MTEGGAPRSDRDKLRELAEAGARAAHYFDATREHHDAENFACTFDICVHPDCVLVREALSASSARPHTDSSHVAAVMGRLMAFVEHSQDCARLVEGVPVQRCDCGAEKASADATGIIKALVSAEPHPPKRPDFDPRYTQCVECGGTFQHYDHCRYTPTPLSAAPPARPDEEKP